MVFTPLVPEDVEPVTAYSDLFGAEAQARRGAQNH